MAAGAGMAALLMMQTALADTASSSSDAAYWPSSASWSSSETMKPRGYNASKGPYSMQRAKEERDLKNLVRVKLRIMNKPVSSSSSTNMVKRVRTMPKQDVLKKGIKALVDVCPNMHPRERAVCLQSTTLKPNRGYRVPVSSSSVSSSASSTY